MQAKLFLLAALATSANAASIGLGLGGLGLSLGETCAPPTTVTNTVTDIQTVTSVQSNTVTDTQTVTSVQLNTITSVSTKTITVTAAPATTTTTAAAVAATTTAAASTCVDVPVPQDPHGCVNQATWGNCSQDWMKGYCKKSCGTCPNPVCEDKPVPGDTNTCEQQASWGNCAASWMTGYCQKSCGTCPGATPLIQTYKTCKTPNTLAIAFDDGATQYQQAIVDQFNAVGGKTTFFTTGKLYQCIYNDSAVHSLRSAFASGHQIASHTWSHPDLTKVDATRQKAELVQLEEALQKIIGAKPTFLRPPYLASNADLKTVLTGLGYRGIVTANVDSNDWNNFTAEQGFNNIVSGLETSQYSGIALMHENYQQTVEILLPKLIEYATKQGIKLVTVSECVGDDVSKMYRDVGVQGVRDDTWVC